VTKADRSLGQSLRLPVPQVEADPVFVDRLAAIATASRPTPPTVVSRNVPKVVAAVAAVLAFAGGGAVAAEHLARDNQNPSPTITPIDQPTHSAEPDADTAAHPSIDSTDPADPDSVSSPGTHEDSPEGTEDETPSDGPEGSDDVMDTTADEDDDSGTPVTTGPENDGTDHDGSPGSTESDDADEPADDPTPSGDADTSYDGGSSGSSDAGDIADEGVSVSRR